MKFKLNKDSGDRELTVKDYMGDELIIAFPGRKHVYIGINDGVFIQLTKRMSIAIAKAIIEELS
jgi:hypothetical protein